MPLRLPFCDYLAVGPGNAMPLPAPPPNALSVFTILSAKAFSSVGFGLSILAIWFGWLLPHDRLQGLPAPGETQVLTVQKLRRGPSSSSKPKRIPPTPMRRSSAPVTLQPVPILESRQENTTQLPNRHVSFADGQPLRRNTVPSENPKSDYNNEAVSPSSSIDTQSFSNALTASPRSSTTILTNSPMTSPTLPMDDEAVGSDNSRHSSKTSLCLSAPRIHKLRLPFNSKGRRTTEKPSDAQSTSSQESVPLAKSPKRSHGFVTPWSHSKKSSTSASANPEIPSPKLMSFSKSPSSASSSSSTSSFPAIILSKKALRRVSTPIPRTSPYEAPYFATPPLLLDDSYASYLRRLPRFEDEVLPVSTPEPSRGRDPSSGNQVNIQTRKNTVPGPIHKRRSASESWSTRLVIER